MESDALKKFLDPILTLGSYEYKFPIGGYEVVYNLVSVGETADVLAAMPMKVQSDEKAARIASVLVSANNYTFNSNEIDTTLEKYRFIRGLKKPLFDLFWNSYMEAEALQLKVFEEVHIKGKKPSPIQGSEQSGDSSSSPE